MKVTKPRVDLVVAGASQAGYKLLGFLVLATLARALSPNDYGLLMFAVSLSALTGWTTDLGASQELIRRAATDPDGALRRLGNVLSARMPVLAAALLAVNLWVGLTKPDAWPVVTALAVYAVGMEVNRTVAGLFIGLRRITDSVRIFGSGLLTLVVAVALGFALEAGLAWMVAAYVLCGLVLIYRSFRITTRAVGRLRLRWKVRGLPSFFAGTIPLLTLTAIGSVYLQIDTLMVGYLHPYQEVARFEAAARLFEASQVLVRPVVMVAFPLCAMLAQNGQWQRLLRTFRLTLAGAVGIGLLAALGAELVADQIIRVVFTSTYDTSAEVLRALFLGACALYAATVGNFVIASLHRDRLALGTLSGGVVLNVVLNAWAIPAHGALGAAWSTVASLSLTALVLCAFAYRSVRSRAASMAARGAASEPVGAE